MAQPPPPPAAHEPPSAGSPGSSRGSLQGELFRFGAGPLSALLHGPRDASRCVVFVPGLTDGLLGLGYVTELAHLAVECGLSFVQPVLSSSYQGFGTSSLSRDTQELDALLDRLMQAEFGAQQFVLIGPCHALPFSAAVARAHD